MDIKKLYISTLPLLTIGCASELPTDSTEEQNNSVKSELEGFGAATSDGERPNIIMILTDDQRWDTLGVAGNSVIQTPTLDKLAREGLYAPQARVTTSISYATRATVLTGQYAEEIGVSNFDNEVDLNTTYPYYLRKAGYTTGFIGKWGNNDSNQAYMERSSDLFDFWGGAMNQTNYWHERNCPYVTFDGFNNKHGFNCTCPADIYGKAGDAIRIGKNNIVDPVHQDTYIIPKKAVEFLDGRDKEKPFCLQLSFKGPHGPMQDWDDAKYSDLYKNVAIPMRDNVTLDAANNLPELLRNSACTDRYHVGKILGKDIVEYPGGELQEDLRDYYKLITGIDDTIAQLLDCLEQRDLLDNTVIIFMGDNGQYFCEHGFTGKWTMYEESIRVPFFMHDPRNKVSATTDDFVLSIDVAPTILDLAGVDVPSAMDGKSLVDLYKNPKMDFRSECFLEHPQLGGNLEYESSECFQDKEWKYFIFTNSDITEDTPGREQLFYIPNDPYELNNLADNPDYAEVLAAYRTKYAKAAEALREQ